MAVKGCTVFFMKCIVLFRKIQNEKDKFPEYLSAKKNGPL